MIRSVGRAVLDAGLKASRWPLDLAARALPDGDGRPRAAVTSVLDRTDAGVRQAIGAALRDDELVADGRRRAIAAEERKRASALRLEAEFTRQAADEQLARERAEAEERREAAERQAEADKAQAAERRRQREAKASQAAAAQERTVEQARRTRQAAADKTAKQQRLAVLEAKEAAVEAEAGALSAADEAERLRTKAAAAKAARKRTG